MTATISHRVGYGTSGRNDDGDDDRFERGVSAFHSGRRFHRGDLFLFGVSGGAPPAAQSHERCSLSVRLNKNAKMLNEVVVVDSSVGRRVRCRR